MRYFLRTLTLCVWGAAWMMGSTPAVVAAEVLPGPIPATLFRVIDGDTVEVRARIWLGQDMEIAVRLVGVDAPELRGKCPEERLQAEAAAAHLKVFEGTQVSLTNIAWDKFGGRVQADVTHPDAGSLGASLMNAGLARAYGGGRRAPWCSELVSTE